MFRLLVTQGLARASSPICLFATPGPHPRTSVFPHPLPSLAADDGPAFQRAIDAAARAAGPGNGQAVYIPPGKPAAEVPAQTGGILWAPLWST